MTAASGNSAALTALLLGSALVLAGCEGFEMPSFGKSGADTETGVTTAEDGSVRLVERDIEAPDVFQVTDSALWDGRPSFGGVWVAYPSNIDPERVIIRNEENQKFVIGALFKREVDNPGPKLQLSSDAAAALGILAGKPTRVSVTALRRESVPDETAAPATDTATTASVADIAAAAIDAADGTATPAPAPAPKPATTLEKPYIQIGIFSVEANAANTATALRTQGIVPLVKAQETKGKKFWRVLIGPATTRSELSALLKKARDMGFADAYYVTN
jgi:rare lipoprotein A